MSSAAKDHIKQVDELLATANQSWLFGAGASLDAGLPLMGPLTTRVTVLADADADKTAANVLKATKSLLPATAHIEHVLSHLCDYIAIAERSGANKVKIGTKEFSSDTLREAHSKILAWIAQTIRWGYVPANAALPEKIGEREKPIVDIKGHLAFMDSLFNRTQAGIGDRRAAIRLFTTNYDTLLEDSLSLSCISHWDGLSGGAVAYRHFAYGDKEPKSGFRAHVIKLHGSIDWHMSPDDKVWRIRDGDLYPAKVTRVLIYPQATKYLATQRDPFAAQFDILRRTLQSGSENVLAVCGYSFGDDHINQEIELAFQRSDSKSTMVIFSQTIPPRVETWRNGPWGRRIYVLAENGLFVGPEGPFAAPAAGAAAREWWTFAGLTKVLAQGMEATIL